MVNYNDERLLNLIKENEHLFEMYDFKLKDLFYDTENLDNDLFYEFCECYYNEFIECVNDSDCIRKNDFYFNYIGRTSSWFFVKGTNVNCDIRRNNDCVECIENIFSQYNDDLWYYDTNDDDMTDDVLSDLKDYIKDLNIVYNIYKDFMDDSINAYNDFIECNEF